MKKFVLLALLGNAAAVKLAHLMKQGGGPPMPSPETFIDLEMAGIHELEREYMDHEDEIEAAIREAEEEVEHDLDDYGIEDFDDFFPDPHMMMDAGEQFIEEGKAEAEATRDEQIHDIDMLEGELEQEAAAEGIELAQANPPPQPPKDNNSGLPPFIPPVEVQYQVIRSIIKDARMGLSRPGLEQGLDDGFKGLREEVKRETGDDLGPPPPAAVVLKDLRGLVDGLDGATQDEKRVEEGLGAVEGDILHEAEAAARAVEGIVHGFEQGLGVDDSKVGGSPTDDATFLLDTIEALGASGALDGAAALIAQGADSEGGSLRPQDVTEGIQRAVGDARRQVAKPDFDRNIMEENMQIMSEVKEIGGEVSRML